jgi:hypothetical protein
VNAVIIPFPKAKRPNAADLTTDVGCLHCGNPNPGKYGLCVRCDDKLAGREQRARNADGRCAHGCGNSIARKRIARLMSGLLICWPCYLRRSER